MRTWILCADNLCAKLFVRKSPDDETNLCRTIPYPPKTRLKKFIHYVVEEIELACGAGTESKLILCAESEILSEYMKQISPYVEGSIIGTVDRNLCHVSHKRVASETRPIHQRAEEWAR